MYKFEKSNKSSTNIFELCFYQDGKEWKQKLFPIEGSKRNTSGVIKKSI